MKYLILNGSPHRGNTWKLTEYVKSCIEEADHSSEFTEIHLRELSLPFCTGCSHCFRNGEEHCPHAGQMQQVLQEFDKADGIIVSTATFNMRETGLLKNLFDHMCYLLHRPRYFTKKALVITTVGGMGKAGTLKSVSGMLQGIGCNRCYRIGENSVSWNSYEPLERTKKKVCRITNRFTKDVLSGRMHFPKMIELIPYNLFRGMNRDYGQEKEYATEDGIYWMRPERKIGAYDRRIPLTPLHRLFGGLFFLCGIVGGRLVTVTYRK
ncbi:MAG TPA: NAD(P)H-dependent oxidoreductase [Lachnospiraceae bacterium]|mgnify:CR=1 FL=1|nr:NAD(P)H-dependent oxidoreductase [Lachnospiraceae bacterium]